MTTLTLDTSGEVFWPGPEGHSLDWTDLDAFTQGAFEEAARTAVAAGIAPEAVAFRNWSAEALAAILADCGAWEALTRGPFDGSARKRVTERRQRIRGEAFWKTRQLSHVKGFPPRAVSLSDDGKVEIA